MTVYRCPNPECDRPGELHVVVEVLMRVAANGTCRLDDDYLFDGDPPTIADVAEVTAPAAVHVFCECGEEGPLARFQTDQQSHTVTA